MAASLRAKGKDQTSQSEAQVEKHQQSGVPSSLLFSQLGCFRTEGADSGMDFSAHRKPYIPILERTLGRPRTEVTIDY